MLLLSLLACAPEGLSPDAPVPEFELVDENPTSASGGLTLSPSDFQGQVSAWYFGSASCPYCVSQLAHLWALQLDLWDANEEEITLLGINAQGAEYYNEEAVEGHDLPWLQDRRDQHVWRTWDVAYRDVIVVGPDLHPVSTYNLTSHDLADAANRAALRQLLEAAAD